MAFKSLVSTRFIKCNLHRLVENGITYQVLVKQLPYTREELDICSKFTYSNRSIKKTVTVKCNRPLQGKYIEIVASSPAETTLKVFEIERFGRFRTYNIFALSIKYELKLLLIQCREALIFKLIFF